MNIEVASNVQMLSVVSRLMKARVRLIRLPVVNFNYQLTVNSYKPTFVVLFDCV